MTPDQQALLRKAADIIEEDATRRAMDVVGSGPYLFRVLRWENNGLSNSFKQEYDANMAIVSQLRENARFQDGDEHV